MNFEPLPDGNLLSVPGLRGAGVACGLKDGGELDLALVVADEPRTAAGVFTRSQLPAAPVTLSRQRLQARPQARAIVINAGNANALTGRDGEQHAMAMVNHTDSLVGGPSLVLSTGVIGTPLPIERVLDGIGSASKNCHPDLGLDVARAMMTTDTRPKTVAVRGELPGGSVGDAMPFTVGGVAKGFGMIDPDMATMLSVLATDAELTSEALDHVLRRAVDRSFHEITIDGDTSTNDAVVVLAGGSEMEPVGLDDPRLDFLEEALSEVCRLLAREIVLDGEGASRVMDIHVSGAASDHQARQVARTIACSPLVKTALAGGDPNWGRILAAAARSGVELNEDDLVLALGGHLVFDGGPVTTEQPRLTEAFGAPEVCVELRIGDEAGYARMLTTDLTERYVQINADYHT